MISRRTLRALAAGGRTIVIATHDEEFVRACVQRGRHRRMKSARLDAAARTQHMATQPLNVDTDARYIELDTDRKIRHRNKLYYRFNHWPIWIFVFFIAPGPWTFDLFAHGFDARLVAVAGGRDDRDRRSRVCAAAFRAASRRRTSSASPKIGRTRCTGASATRPPGARSSRLRVLNIAGLAWAVISGEWRLRQMYEVRLFPDRRHDVGARRAG